MEGKIQTLHPQGKSGVNISKEKYDVMKETITSLLRKKPLTHIGMEPVKLDLEARKVIRRVPKSTPQRIRLA